jgi:peroxiredoxin
MGQCWQLARADDLTLAVDDIDGGRVELIESETERWTVVCFLGVECPLARLYAPRLLEFSQRFKDDPVQWIGVDSNRQDSINDLRRFSEELEFSFPLVHDKDNKIADRYGATRTPEVFVLDQHLQVRYRGRIDDQYFPGRAKAKATRHDLQLALEQLVSHRSVDVPRTEAVGCLIGRVKVVGSGSSVSYSRQVVRVLQRHCIECHREGEIGPFSLTDYDEVVGWADALMESIDEGRMPPWHANPAHGKFHNERRISLQDKQVLRQWIEAGAPRGDPSEMPEPVKYSTGWQLPRKPDLVLPMRGRPFLVPATGTVEYQYFVVDPGFTEGRWITAAEVMPGARSVVHHCIVFIRPPDGARFRGVGWLSGFVPGQRTVSLPSGHARFVPAGSKLVFQMHYTPTGTAEQDLTKIGLIFADAKDVTHEVITVIGIDQDFEIPPHAAHHQVTFRVSNLPQEGKLLAIIPHMHLRGRSFRLRRGEGTDGEILLDVPKYDFNWQHSYQLVEPLSLKDISSLHCSVVFDNSGDNPTNPDPSQWVTWGDQTWEEMAVAFFAISEPRSANGRDSAVRPLRETEKPTYGQAKVRAFVDEFFQRHDKNRDGVIARHEVPRSIRTFYFYYWDMDGDDRIRRDELQQRAQQKFRNEPDR